MTIVSVDTPVGVVDQNPGCGLTFRVFLRRISGETPMARAKVRDESGLAMVPPGSPPGPARAVDLQRERMVALARDIIPPRRPADRTVEPLHPRGSSREDDMHPLLLTVAAGAGLGLIVLTTSPADSITITTPTAVRQTADALALTEAVHCRRYLHWHRNGHGWSRGCSVEPVVVDPPAADGVVRAGPRSFGAAPRIGAPSAVGRPPGSSINPSNPQDRSGSSNRQDMMQPRAINPQDMR
jgi:hypothetical protein